MQKHSHGNAARDALKGPDRSISALESLPVLVQRYIYLIKHHPHHEACLKAGITSSQGTKIIKKLGRLGMFFQPGPIRFSPADEAFFASEVKPPEEWEEWDRTASKPWNKVVTRISRLWRRVNRAP